MELSITTRAALRPRERGVVFLEIIFIFSILVLPFVQISLWQWPEMQRQLRELSKKRLNYDGEKQWRSLEAYTPGG